MDTTETTKPDPITANARTENAASLAIVTQLKWALTDLQVEAGIVEMMFARGLRDGSPGLLDEAATRAEQLFVRVREAAR